MASPHFRAGVIAVVRRPDGTVLACERCDNPGQWQLPQGGMKAGESPKKAAWRELKEETGLGKKSVRLVGEYPYWTVYEWRNNTPRHGRYGQAHRWFVFEPTGEVSPKVDNREFCDWKWIDPDKLARKVVRFRRKPYKEVFKWLRREFERVATDSFS